MEDMMSGISLCSAGEEIRNTCKIFVRKPQGERSYEDPR